MATEQYRIDDIASALSRFQPQHFSDGAVHRKAASVAMLLRECCGQAEMLFIERAADERDPWSGHLAFPGGKIEEGEDPRQAAVRETDEEVGIRLPDTSYLGRLSDIVGTNLPVQVSCHLFAVREDVVPSINGEVRDLFWVPLHEIYNRQRHTATTVRFAESSFETPAIILPKEGKPVLWGITYRLVMQLHEILQVTQKADCNLHNKRYTHTVEYL